MQAHFAFMKGRRKVEGFLKYQKEPRLMLKS